VGGHLDYKVLCVCVERGGFKEKRRKSGRVDEKKEEDEERGR
jgi:hypothetical protein